MESEQTRVHRRLIKAIMSFTGAANNSSLKVLREATQQLSEALKEPQNILYLMEVTDILLVEEVTTDEDAEKNGSPH